MINRTPSTSNISDHFSKRNWEINKIKSEFRISILLFQSLVMGGTPRIAVFPGFGPVFPASGGFLWIVVVFPGLGVKAQDKL